VIDTEHQKMVEEDEVRNGVIRMMTRFLGAGDDRVKARKSLEKGTYPLDHAEYFVMLSRVLLDNQKIFASTALRDPDKYQIFFQKAVDCYNLAVKILKAKPNKDVQADADKVKADIEALKKKGLKAS
jgi:hypothetical protein